MNVKWRSQRHQVRHHLDFSPLFYQLYKWFQFQECLDSFFGRFSTLLDRCSYIMNSLLRRFSSLTGFLGPYARRAYRRTSCSLCDLRCHWYCGIVPEPGCSWASKQNTDLCHATAPVMLLPSARSSSLSGKLDSAPQLKVAVESMRQSWDHCSVVSYWQQNCAWKESQDWATPMPQLHLLLKLLSLLDSPSC